MSKLPSTVISSGGKVVGVQSIPKGVPGANGQDHLEPTTDQGRAAAALNRGKKENRVQVAVRIRPMSKADGGQSDKAVNVQGHNVIKLARQGETAKDFNYDYVFQGEQEEVFDCIGKPMLADAYEGYNVTLFAYGQTGSGKTHSIMGPVNDPGVVPRFCHTMLSVAQDKLEHDTTLSVKIAMTYLEIYNEKVRDLLEKRKPGQTEATELHVREDSNKKVYVDGATVHTILNVQRVEQLLAQGSANRQTSETNMNETSSRSHSVVIFYLSQTHDPPNPESRDIESCIYLVDLAGSERQSKTGATGDRFEEAKKINLSLLMLGRALNSFSEGKGGPPPLRESKLTRILSESFGGNSRTWMLACCSPSVFNYTETHSTLTYAQNAKNIINHAKVNAMQQRMELQALKLAYAKLQDLFENEKSKTKQLQMELQERSKLHQAATEEIETLKAQLEGRPPKLPSLSTPLFVGRAKLSLKNIIQQVSSYNTLPLVTENPENDGAALMVNTFPVVDKEKPHIEYDDVQEGLKELQGKRLDLVVHVISAKGIPKQYCHKVYCKYVFKYKERQVFQSEMRMGQSEPEFDYKKRFAWSDLSLEQAEYLMSDNVLTFEVIGHPANSEP